MKHIVKKDCLENSSTCFEKKSRKEQILYAGLCSFKDNPQVSEYKILLVNIFLKRAKESMILCSQYFVLSVVFYPPGMDSYLYPSNDI